MNWIACSNGATIGTSGSDGGAIRRDEEHVLGARITLEAGGTAPFAITCGIPGILVHTAFAATELDGCDSYDAMKADIEALLDLWPDSEAETDAKNRFHDALQDFVRKY